MSQKNDSLVKKSGFNPWTGTLVSLGILSTWAISFGAAITQINLSSTSPFVIAIVAYTISFLFIGLFITAHDSMHGTLAPHSRSINLRLGQLSAALYGAFSLHQLRSAHFKHHEQPASPNDPDYDSKDGQSHPVVWWLQFMWRYFTFRQFVILAAIANVLIHGFGISDRNIIAFWIVPSLWSSFQLFYFGTYLPHRSRSGDPHKDAHHARSNRYPAWLSFLTCYHFGYHWEHHQHPSLAWWQLPAARQKDPRL